jgi:hypothetical protein
MDVHEGERNRPLARALLAVLVLDGVQQDSEQPARVVSPLPKLCERSMCLEARLLNQVLRVVGIADLAAS